jgi:pimeloyl-ACP methyl ester carboxylesterase
LFAKAFANDLPAKQGAVLAATQRPVTYGALTEASSTPAWKTIPSWDLVGTIDQVIPKAQQLFMANRAHAHVTLVKSSHLPMISKPAAVQQIIETAARATD